MRRDDNDATRSLYFLTRTIKAAMGILALVGAVVVAVWGHAEGLNMVLMVLGLALVGGLMLDAPSVTNALSLVLQLLPGRAPDK